MQQTDVFGLFHYFSKTILFSITYNKKNYTPQVIATIVLVSLFSKLVSTINGVTFNIFKNKYFVEILFLLTIH